jgi:hypothetical protein
MEAKEDKHLWKYLAVGAALGLSYGLVNYLAASKKSKAKPLSLERTQKALR